MTKFICLFATLLVFTTTSGYAQSETVPAETPPSSETSAVEPTDEEAPEAGGDQEETSQPQESEGPSEPAEEEAASSAGEDVEVVIPSGPGPQDDVEEPEVVAEPEAEVHETAEPSAEPGVADEPVSEPGMEAMVDEEEGEGLDFFIELSGAYRVRTNLMDDVPLTSLESRGFGDTLGQRWWVNQWFRVAAEIGIRDRLQLVTELDVARGLLAGDFTQGVEAAERPRSDVDFLAEDGIQLRKVFLEWMSPIGLLRAGLMPSHWGYGILANDGAHERPFGDPDFGDRVLRLALATKPFGEDSDFYAALAGDIVYRDLLADFTDGDRAYQGVLALWYQHEARRVGFYLARRNQEMPVDAGAVASTDELASLEVFVVDVFARWDWEAPSGGMLHAGLEGALVYGETDASLSVSDLDGGESFDDIRQFLLSAEVGFEGEEHALNLETGYSSGDSNVEDDFQRRGTLDPDHQVGLILFPEVMAWQTARSATLARSPELFGRPARGAELLPTNGGVAGAMYLFPTWQWQVSDWAELRLGAVWARATSDVVDPYRQRSESRARNYRGGDPRNRDLGLEVDAAVLFNHPLNPGVRIRGGIEGGYFIPGRAFDDENGESMPGIGLLRARFGLEF